MRIVREEEVVAHQAQQEKEWEPLPTTSSTIPAATPSKKSKSKSKAKVVEESEDLFWGDAPSETPKVEAKPASKTTETSDDLFWGAEEPKKEETVTPKKKGKGKGKESATNAWTKSPQITADPVWPAANPKKSAQKPVVSAWGNVPKAKAKSMSEIMKEQEAASEADRIEQQFQQQQQKEAESRRTKNAWGVIPSAGGSSVSMTEENFPSLGGNSSSSVAPRRNQSGNGGLNYASVVGQVAPSAQHLDEAFPALGAPVGNKRR